MLRMFDTTPTPKLELFIDESVLRSSPLTEREIRLITRTATSKLLKMEERMSIYNIEQKTELIFKKTDSTKHVMSISLIKVIPHKELLLNEGLLTYKPDSIRK
jgi:hypothetical protein